MFPSRTQLLISLLCLAALGLTHGRDYAFEDCATDEAHAVFTPTGVSVTPSVPSKDDDITVVLKGETVSKIKGGRYTVRAYYEMDTWLGKVRVKALEDERDICEDLTSGDCPVPADESVTVTYNVPQKGRFGFKKQAGTYLILIRAKNDQDRDIVCVNFTLEMTNELATGEPALKYVA